MRYLLLLTIILHCSMQESFSQIPVIWECGTTAPSKDLLKDDLQIKEYSTFTITNKVFRVYFHVIRRSNGTGGLTTAQINTVLDTLRNDYSAGQVCFVELGRSFIDNDYYYYSFSDSKFNQLVQNNRLPNAINIYLLPTSGWPGTGSADGIPSNALVINGNLALTSVISHEVGHCLGLYHTHSGRGCDDFTNCAENINGSNCATCGDLVCDTPADPCLSGLVDASCNYTGGGGFNPDVSNIMSYTRPTCMLDFTTGQVSRMHAMISNSSIIQNTLVKIDGPDRIPCMANATFSIPAISGATYSWSVQSPLQILSGQGTNSIQVSSTQNNFSSADVQLTLGGCGMAITKNVGPGTPEAAQYIDIFDPVTSPTNLCPNRTYRIEASGYQNTYYEFFWTLPAGWSSPDAGNGSNTFTTYGLGGFTVRVRTGSQPTAGPITVRAVNACGMGDAKTIGVSTQNCNPLGSFIVYPNPADETLTIEYSEFSSRKEQSNVKYSGEII